MVSYSSLEHGGLGRFGDAMHPWGDLVTMAKAWCMVKKGGHAVIAVPSARQDTIEYNAHRYYIYDLGKLIFQKCFYLKNKKIAWPNIIYFCLFIDVMAHSFCRIYLQTGESSLPRLILQVVTHTVITQKVIGQVTLYLF